MRGEYLLFNLLIVLGPVVLSFDDKVRYVKRWPAALLASGVILFPYLLWDASVQGVHWWFNPKYTLPFRLLGLPAGEWLFFITVPFASLFIWEIIDRARPPHFTSRLRIVRILAQLGAIPGIAFYLSGRHYTGLTLLVLALVATLDRLMATRLLEQPRAYLYLSLLTAAMFIFNGYLTARPVVLYDPTYQLNLRLLTIPIEDFFYGYGHLLLCTMVYQKLRRNGRWVNASSSSAADSAD